MDEDFALRRTHPMYDSFCNEDEGVYDPDGGAWDYECDKWETYDDMGR